MHRRTFLELSALAAIATPAKEVMALNSADHQPAAPQMIVTPEEAQVYKMLGGGEAPFSEFRPLPGARFLSASAISATRPCHSS